MDYNVLEALAAITREKQIDREIIIESLLLLAIGVRMKSGSLRWLSLGILVLTLGKVFLHDLGELEDLYRVASLVGLALSLIIVSLIYQRFVFRTTTEDAS